jgi:hypothetical protein
MSNDRAFHRKRGVRAKLLNLLFGLCSAKGATLTRITVNMVHPGVTWTEMTRSQTWHSHPSWRWIWPIMRLVMRHGSPETAARRVAFPASSPQAATYIGQHFERKHEPKRLSTRGLNPAIQERAWQPGLELVVGAPTRRTALAGSGTSPFV